MSSSSWRRACVHFIEVYAIPFYSLLLFFFIIAISLFSSNSCAEYVSDLVVRACVCLLGNLDYVGSIKQAITSDNQIRQWKPRAFDHHGREGDAGALRYRRLWGSQWSYPRTQKKWIIAVNLGRNPKACSVCHGLNWCLTRSKPFFWSMETKLFSFLNDPETSNMLQINMALISLPSPQ